MYIEDMIFGCNSKPAGLFSDRKLWDRGVALSRNSTAVGAVVLQCY